MFYNFGVQLKSKSGIYAKYSYLKHARGSLNLHSLHLLLWTNFSAFCVSLVTRQNADLQLRTLFSDDLPVRSYCISQLRSLWTNMRKSLNALDEELVFLVQRCSDMVIQVRSELNHCNNIISHAQAFFAFHSESNKSLRETGVICILQWTLACVFFPYHYICTSGYAVSTFSSYNVPPLPLIYSIHCI